MAYRASGTFTSGTGTITPPYPGSMQVNDVCLLAVESENQVISLSSAQGFVEVPTWSPQSAGTAATNPASRLAVFWKRTVGGDTAPTVADSGDHTTGQIHCFSGVITSGNPWDTGAGGNDSGANDTTGTIPGATTTVDSTLVVLITSTSFNGTSTTQCSGWTNANLTSLTERADNTNTINLGGGHCLATGDKATAGSYATTTVTLANTSYKGAISLALKPAPPNPTQIHYRWRNDNGGESPPLNIALICATATCTDVNIDVPLKNHLSTTLGHTVTTFIGTNVAWTPTNYDVVVISESTNSGDTAWLKNQAVPILTVEGQNWDEFELGTSGDSNIAGNVSIDITDNSHYITSGFPLGTLQVNNTGTDTALAIGYMSGLSNGVTPLANVTTFASRIRLSYVNAGGVLVGGVNTAAERRVFFAARYFGTLNANGIILFNRSLEWVSYAVGAATFAANEDTPLIGHPKLTPIRARIEVSNEGGGSTGALTYRLEYALSTAGPWTTVPSSATAEDWEMVDSIHFVDGLATQNIVPGLTDENTTFVAGQLKDTGSTTSAITLSSTQFTEIEYSVRATNNSTNCQTYYFRVTNTGSTTGFTFTVYPQITLAGSPVCVAPVPITNLTITAYNSENTITWDNPAANYTQILVLAKTTDCTFSTNPTGIEAINDTVGTGVVIFNGNPAVDMASTSVTVGGSTTVSYTASTQRLVHSGLTDGTVYCYKVYARNGDLIDDNSGSGRPSVTAKGTSGVAPSAVWSFNLISTAGATLVQPSLDPGASIYTSYGSGTLASMGATNGLLAWRMTPASGAIQDQSAVVWMSGSSTCGLAGATNCVFAASQDGYVYARNASTGAAAWSYRHAAGDVLQGAPSVQIKDYSNGGYTPTVDRLFAVTRNATTSANKVYALDPTVAPPTLAWLFTGGGANPNMDMVSSPPVLDYTNNRIYVTSNSNGTTQRSLWVFDTVTGTLISTGATYGGTGIGDSQVAPALSIDGSVVYVGTAAGAVSTVKAYNTSTGALNWSFSTASPVVSGIWVEWRAGLANNLFFTTANGKIWRIKDNGASASDLWGGGAPTITSASFPIVIPTAGKVYVGGCSGADCASSSLGKLYQLAVSTGTKEQCRSLGTNITVGDPAFDTVLERLLAGTSEGKVHEFAAPAGLLGGDPSCTP